MKSPTGYEDGAKVPKPLAITPSAKTFPQSVVTDATGLVHDAPPSPPSIAPLLPPSVPASPPLLPPPPLLPLLPLLVLPSPLVLPLLLVPPPSVPLLLPAPPPSPTGPPAASPEPPQDPSEARPISHSEARGARRAGRSTDMDLNRVMRNACPAGWGKDSSVPACPLTTLRAPAAPGAAPRRLQRDGARRDPSTRLSSPNLVTRT